MAESSVELPEVLPARSPEVEVAEFDTAFVVFDPRNRMAHRIEGQHALLFDVCDGRTASAALVQELRECGIDSDEAARSLVAQRLAELAELGVLEGGEPPEPPPCVGCGGGAKHPRRRWSVSR